MICWRLPKVCIKRGPHQVYMTPLLLGANAIQCCSGYIVIANVFNCGTTARNIQPGAFSELDVDLWLLPVSSRDLFAEVEDHYFYSVDERHHDIGEALTQFAPYCGLRGSADSVAM